MEFFVWLETNFNPILNSTDPDLELGLTDLVRLLLGPFPPAIPEETARVVRRLFPLPLYWHNLSHV